MSGVLELLPGGVLKTPSRKQAVTAAALPAWCAGFAAGETGLKMCKSDLAGENGPRTKSGNAERAMAGELPQRAQPATGECQSFSQAEVEAIWQAGRPSPGRHYGFARRLYGPDRARGFMPGS